MYTNYEMRHILTVVIATSLVCLAGCVSQPAPVKAHLPLVNVSQFSANSSSLVANVNNQAKGIPELTVSSGEFINLDGKEYLVADEYLSALGHSCHKLTTVTQGLPPESRALCRSNEGWILFPATISKTY